jgi:hypothetical protein
MRRAYSCAALGIARTLSDNGVTVVGSPLLAEFVELLVEIVCALHDAGKLTSEWQTPAWQWQRQKDDRLRKSGARVPERPKDPIAHTSFDPKLDQDFKRPHHAVEGAFAVAEFLVEHLSGLAGEQHGPLLAQCILSAIARHHAPRSKECGTFCFAQEVFSTVDATMPESWRPVRLSPCRDRITSGEFVRQLLLFREGDEAGFLLYAFLVRRLRLADQSSFQVTKNTA